MKHPIGDRACDSALCATTVRSCIEVCASLSTGGRVEHLRVSSQAVPDSSGELSLKFNDHMNTAHVVHRARFSSQVVP
jgi:hypothetical protein